MGEPFSLEFVTRSRYSSLLMPFTRPLAIALAALALSVPVTQAATDKGAARRVLSEAEVLYRRGEFKEAMRSVNAALEGDSRLGAAYELRARLWHAAADASRQKADSARALELLGVGTGSLAVDELVAQGGAQLLLGHVDKALESFNAALKGDKKTSAALYARSRVWREKADLPKAIADIDEALKLEPKIPLWLYSRGRARFDKGEDAKAITDLTSALRANKNFTLAFALIGSAMARSGDFKRAAKAYDRAIGLDPEYVYAYLGRAALKLRLGDEPGALKDFEEAVRADAQDYAPYYNRGELHWRGGRREQALSDYRNAMTSPKLTPEASLAIGDRYLSLQLWKDAIAAYGRARELGSTVPALLRRARALESDRDPKRALADLDEAVKSEPDNAPLLAARGSLLSRMGSDAAALGDFNRALRQAPTDAEILVARASFYAHVEKPSLALEDFTKAINADPKYAEAYNGRGALYVNALAEPDKALRDVMKAVERNASPQEEPQKVIDILSRAYLEFALDNKRMWNLLFTHYLPEGMTTPAALHDNVNGVSAIVAGQLAKMLPTTPKADVDIAAKALWAGVHGITAIAVTDKGPTMTSATALTFVKMLTSTYTRGLTVKI